MAARTHHLVARVMSIAYTCQAPVSPFHDSSDIGIILSHATIALAGHPCPPLPKAALLEHARRRRVRVLGNTPKSIVPGTPG